MLICSTNHAAHVGGFTAGSLFYLLAARPLKMKYFPVRCVGRPHHSVVRTVEVRQIGCSGPSLPRWDVRKWYLMTVTLGAYAAFFWASNHMEASAAGAESPRHPAVVFTSWELGEEAAQVDIACHRRCCQSVTVGHSHATLCTAARDWNLSQRTGRPSLRCVGHRSARRPSTQPLPSPLAGATSQSHGKNNNM